MSVQTGSMPPSGPASQGLVDRARFRASRLAREPNPIWIRELRQSARLARTPVILTILTILMTLLMASIGGIVSTDASPANTGVILFQVYFSLAYAVATVIGPTVAANSIASEREGRTWEAVVLTGLSPATIAHGKFLSAFTSIAMYLVMLAPVGALPFLFGGVTATETVVAFAFLFLIAGLSVAMGLSISSKMASLRAAIVVTILLSFTISAFIFCFFGLALSFAAHKAWPGVSEWLPVWLPVAYERAPFNVEYVIFLLILPITAVTLPAWFLYEVTIANLTSVTDDRSTGLKRWFLVTAPVLTAAAAVPAFFTSGSDRVFAAASGIAGLSVFLAFCVFLIIGDPIGPSRRVVMHWDRTGVGRFRRFLGPGVIRSSWLVLLAGVLGLLVSTGLGVLAIDRATSSVSEMECIAALGTYAVAFFVFTAGVGAFLRARASSALFARVVLFLVLFAVSVGPWVIAAVAGLIAERGSARDALIVGAPSPFYVFVMFDAIHHTYGSELIAAGVICMAFWAALGFIFLEAARRRCARVIAQHEAALAETDRLLAAEDAAFAAGATEEAIAPPEADAPAPDAPAPLPS